VLKRTHARFGDDSDEDGGGVGGDYDHSWPSPSWDRHLAIDVYSKRTKCLRNYFSTCLLRKIEP